MDAKDKQSLYEKSHFPEKLRALREESGLSRKELAEKLTNNSISISASTIASYENGKTCPNPDRCVRLCEVLDVSLDYLFSNGERERLSEGYVIDDAYRRNMLDQVKEHFGESGELYKLKKEMNIDDRQLDVLLLGLIDQTIRSDLT